MINYKEDEIVKVTEYISYLDNFLSEETCDKIIDYFEGIEDQKWGFVAFYNSRAKHYPQKEDPDGLNKVGLPVDIFDEIGIYAKRFTENMAGKELVLQSSPHCQKWFEGGYASPHSDNSDFDGNYNGFQRNKCSCLIYLNDDYEGGQLHFPQSGIELKPKKGTIVAFHGGHYNIHGVKEVISGVRYTNGFFWDFADAVYTEEEKAMWKEYMDALQKEQAKIREEWTE